MTTPSTKAQVLQHTAMAASALSRDRSTKVGCFIDDGKQGVFSANSFPFGVDDNVDARHERPAKYKWTEHAERNAIYKAAKRGIPLDGATMYLPFYPCADCARAIIQSGIVELVCYEPNWNDPTWGEDFKIAAEMLSEAGIVQSFEEKL